jgi:hypothetical protein
MYVMSQIDNHNHTETLQELKLGYNLLPDTSGASLAHAFHDSNMTCLDLTKTNELGPLTCHALATLLQSNSCPL